ncbi:MAG: copper resistance protein CopC, partial [Actinomycetota bacterium]
MIRSRSKLAVTAGLIMMLGVPGAHAHGNLQRTIPQADAVLKNVPNHVLLQFSQRPKKNARITVLDGCRRPAVRTLQLQGDTAHIEIKPQAQPGNYRVSYRIVSAVDGDATRGNYGFRVGGSADCSEASPEEESE